MKNFYHKQKGFTLLETLVAIFILFVALNSLFTLTSNNFFASRYARNESTAIYLAQEAIDYIRNDRDTTAFQNNALNTGWEIFLSHYGDTTINSLCYSSSGCIIDATNWSAPFGTNLDSVKPCLSTPPVFGEIDCQFFQLEDSSVNGSYYTYTIRPVGQRATSIKRQIKLKQNPNNLDELQIMVNVEWQNGHLAKSLTARASLLRWQ